MARIEIDGPVIITPVEDDELPPQRSMADQLLVFVLVIIGLFFWLALSG